jgi:hypothetical protein
MSICNVCLNLKKSIIHRPLELIKISANRGCRLCDCLKEGIDQLRIHCNHGIPDSLIELCITASIGTSVKVTVQHEARDFGNDYENELEFYTKSGMCVL